jgi:hypothetical protein
MVLPMNYANHRSDGDYLLIVGEQYTILLAFELHEIEISVATSISCLLVILLMTSSSFIILLINEQLRLPCCL